MLRRFLSTLRDSDLIRMTQRQTVPKTRVYSQYDGRAGQIIKALRIKDYQLVKDLARGANINGHTWNENTPLTDSAMRGDNEAIEFLVKEMKADLNASCDCPHNKTALHYASEYGHENTVRVLIELGADPNVLDSRGYTPIDLAKTKTISGVLKLFGGTSGDLLPKNRLNLPRKGPCQSIVIHGSNNLSYFITSMEPIRNHFETITEKRRLLEVVQKDLEASGYVPIRSTFNLLFYHVNSNQVFTTVCVKCSDKCGFQVSLKFSGYQIGRPDLGYNPDKFFGSSKELENEFKRLGVVRKQ